MKFKQFCIDLVLVISIMSSCKKEKKTTWNLIEKPKTQIEKSIILSFEFNDTVAINQEVSGKLKYNLQIDSLKQSDIDDRFLLLYLTAEGFDLNLKNIQKTNHRIFTDTIGNGTIDFSFSFKKIGNNFLNGIIEDKIILKKPTIDGTIMIRTNEVSLTKNIFVKE